MFEFKVFSYSEISVIHCNHGGVGGMLFNLVETLRKRTFPKGTRFQNISEQSNETTLTERQAVKALQQIVYL